MLLECGSIPHGGLQFAVAYLGVILLDGVIGKVRVLVLEHVRVIVLQTEPQVELIVEPDFGWVVVFDDNPNADIEFPPVDYEWILDILLDHVLGLFAQAGVQNVI